LTGGLLDGVFDASLKNAFARYHYVSTIHQFRRDGTMAKKTAKKKTPAPKKKATKRAMPTKNCPKCSKELHVAKVVCDCGFKFPAKKNKKRAKIAATSSGEGTLSQKLAESIKIVEKAGGIDQAKQVLAAVKDLENLR
jgi:hypothetical protein